ALLRAGLEGMAGRGAAKALVLGDPAYYGRFGFTPERDIATPCPIPPEWRDAWQSLALGPGSETIRGTLAPPAPWMRPALWMP
ncbi:MAG: N-acetyltransferase, partial [Rhizobiaceae bacterium]